MSHWFRILASLCVAIMLATLSSEPLAQTAVDLPLCEANVPGSNAGLSIGIVQPHASDHLVNYAARLTLADPALSICAESWRDVLPRWVPWSSQLERGLGFGVFMLAFIAAVTLLWLSTPRQWWRRTTLLGVLGVAGLTWALGVAGLAALQALGWQRLAYDTVVSVRVPRKASVEWFNLKGARDLEALLAGRGLVPGAAAAVRADPAPNIATPSAEPIQAAGRAPSGSYRVTHRLNLRSGPGTQHEWQVTLPRSEVVQFDGATQGDWWRVRRSSGAVGWCSSLWLRRPDESLPSAAPSDAAPRS